MISDDGTAVTVVVPPGAAVVPVGPTPPAAPHPLPFTGFGLGASLVAALLLVVLGALLVRTGSRSRRTS